MKTLLLTAFASFSVVITAQITITSADFATVNDTVRMSMAMDPAIDFMTTGPNQNWDFSSLTPNDQKLVEYNNLSNVSFLIELAYGTFAAAKYKATYTKPSTNLPIDQLSGILPISISDPKSYYRLTADSMSMVGYALTIEGNEAPFKSDNIEAYYKFPITYGSTYSGYGYTNVDLNPFYDGAWIQKRTRNSDVDGWGSITTPYGTFNAIRVRHVIDEVDSVLISFLGSPMWVEIPVPLNYSYEWWTNGEKDAILRINTRRVNGQEIVTDIEYRDTYQSLATVDAIDNAVISIYPNPASEVINVLGGHVVQSYQIFDQSGKEVIRGFGATEQINIQELEKGSYLLLLKTGSELIQETFIKR